MQKYHSSLMSFVRSIELLRSWFLHNKRSFPWRENKTPYAVLVSEMMLQQTQSVRVVTFFENFMNQFPTIEALANAPLEAVYKAWEGLGYYSRARALHDIAKTIVSKHKGLIPCSLDELMQLKGLGNYTARAILAFAFHQNVCAVDANVCRVLARFFAIEEDTSKQTTKNSIQELAHTIIPHHDGYVIAEALIELGATLCHKTQPRCQLCPLQSDCKAYLYEKTDHIPMHKKPVKYEKLYRDVAVIISDTHLLLQKNSPGTIMEGLYEFPYFSSKPGGFSLPDATHQVKDTLSLPVQGIDTLAPIPQSFTKYRVMLYPKIFRVPKKDVIGFTWHSLEEISSLSFSSGHKKVLIATRPLLERLVTSDTYSML